MTRCNHCGDAIDAKTLTHWKDAGHHGLCCDCVDLRHGMPLEALNAGRVANGKLPITKPRPGRGETE